MSQEKCNVKLYDQDDGEVSYCQLPKGHSRKQAHTPWPELRINKPEPHFSFPHMGRQTPCRDPEKAKAVTPLPPIPEDPPEICKEYCKDCGAETATWFTDSDIWNLLDTPGILCPNCFVHLIEARGFATTGWKLVPEERIAKLTAEVEIRDKALEDCWFNEADMPLLEWRESVLLEAAAKLAEEKKLLATRTPPQEGQ